MKWLDTVARLIDGFMEWRNRSELKKSQSDPARYLADDDGELRESTKSYDSISGKPKSNPPK